MAQNDAVLMNEPMSTESGKSIHIDFDGTMIGRTNYFGNIKRAADAIGKKASDATCLTYYYDLSPEKRGVFIEAYTKAQMSDPRSFLQSGIVESIAYAKSKGLTIVVWTAEFPETVMKVLARQNVKVDRIESTFGTYADGKEVKKTKTDLLNETSYEPMIVVGDRLDDLKAAMRSGRKPNVFIAIARTDREKEDFNRIVSESKPDFALKVAETLRVIAELI
jgi:phosphoglycolate phosphatase-like HAD superfamily hydrolase